jgi:hypothetical protein
MAGDHNVVYCGFYKSGNLDVAKWNLYFSKRWPGENGKFFLVLIGMKTLLAKPNATFDL